MLEHDRKRAGWSVARASWELGVTIREYRALEAGRSLAELRRWISHDALRSTTEE